MKALIPVEVIEQRILLIRGQRVMLDADLAMLYGVPTRVLNQAVRRNLKRFPQDFMFKLTQPEKDQVITIWVMKFGVRLGIFGFGILHNKVGHSKCGMLIAECGIQNTKNSISNNAKGIASATNQ